MAGNRCHVSGCKVRNSKDVSKENGVTFFKIPKNSLSIWQELMPESEITQSSKICSRHFDVNDVVKGVNISNVFHPYQRWKLRKGALPTLNLVPDGNANPALKNVLQDNWKRNVKRNMNVQCEEPSTFSLKRKGENLESGRNKMSKLDSSKQLRKVVKQQKSVDKQVQLEVVLDNTTNLSLQPTTCSTSSLEDGIDGHSTVEDVPVQVQLECVGDSTTNVTPLSTAALTSPLEDHIDDHSTLEVADVPVQVQLECVGESTTNVTPLSTATLTSPLEDHIDDHSTLEVADVPVQVQLEGVGDSSTNVTPLSTAALTSPLKDHIDGHSTMEDVEVQAQHNVARDCTTNMPPTAEAASTSTFETNFATYQSLAQLTKLPNDGHGWMWSFNENNQTICCTNPNFLPCGKMLVRTVQVLASQKVLYYFNGKKISSSDLENNFSLIEDLSRLIIAFGLKTICTGISDRTLHTVETSTRTSCVWDNDGVLRSTKCSFVSEKSKLCEKCFALKQYIRKKLKTTQKQVEIKRPKFRCCSSTKQKQTKIDNGRRRIRVLESRAKNTTELVKQLRRDCTLLAEREARGNLDNLLRNLSETVTINPAQADLVLK